MNDTYKSFVAAGAVVLACSSVYLGSSLRDRADLGESGGKQSRDPLGSRLVASREDIVEDVNVPVGEFYDEMVKLLKQQYVEPVTDEQKLASGAVRGMILSLGDSRSNFMDKDQFQAFLNVRMGKFEGIGADFQLQSEGPRRDVPIPGVAASEDPEEAAFRAAIVPKLVVSIVVPNGPADKAGVKPGDVVSYIDNHYVVEDALLQKVTNARNGFSTKKISYEQYNAVVTEFRKKIERAIMPMKAKDKLMVGKSGSLTVVWNRKGISRTTTLQKGISILPGFSVKGNTITLPFDKLASSNLQKALAGKSELTIDLRNNAHGDFDSMRKCLKVVAPSGTYGYLVTERKEKPEPVVVTHGNAHPPKITLLVDQSTRGSAEIFALALSTKGLAKLSGSEMGGDRSIREIVKLPDGSGYSLMVARYRAKFGEKTAMLNGKGSL